MNIQQLVTESKQGSGAAQKLLFERLAPGMLIQCRRYVRSIPDAEELMLNGFTQFFRGLARFEFLGEAALYAWLKKIMVNECLMFLRKKNLFMVVAGPETEGIPLDSSVFDKFDAEDIFHSITELPPGYRTVFNLYELEGMSHKEIAQALNISEGTSKSQLSKAKTLLQKLLIQKDQHYASRKTR